jgi:DNA polymerase III subunit gamma/tau
MAAADVPGGAPAAPAALYRKYRPATFAELKGQEHVSEPLRQALRSGRVHHAYLFSGPRGCGKTSSARILARSLNCEQGPTPDPCGQCASCIALAPSGPGSIDVMEIDAASHGGVDDARDLRERAFYAPVASRFKIYIVDEAHMVTREGFNALLKLVEEPPSHLKFVFATTEPEKVIPTIRSRTHHYAFRLMPPAVLRALLEEILGAEGARYEPEVLPVVVRAGAGSARDSLSVLDQLLAGSGDDGLTYERAVALLGYTDDRLLDEVTEAFAAGDGAAVFGAVKRVVEGGHDSRRFAADLLDRLRDLIILAAVPAAGQTGLLDVPADRLDRMRDQAAAFGQARLTRAAEAINAGLVEMRGAASPRLQLELICAQVLLPAEPAGSTGPAAGPGSSGGGTADVTTLLARIERLERLLGSERPAAAPRAAHPSADTPAESAGGRPAADRAPTGLAAAPAAGAAQPAGNAQPGGAAQAAGTAQPGRAAQPSGTAQPGGTGQPGGAASPGGAAREGASAVGERWQEVLEAVKRERRVAWMLLSNSSVDSLEENVLTLRFAREGEARGFSGSGYEEDLKTVLTAMFGISPRIKVVTGAAEGGRGPVGRAPGNAGPGTGSAGEPHAGTSADADPPAASPPAASPPGSGQPGAAAGRPAAAGERPPGAGSEVTGGAGAGSEVTGGAGAGSAGTVGTGTGSAGGTGSGISSVRAAVADRAAASGGRGRAAGRGNGSGGGVPRGAAAPASKWMPPDEPSGDDLDAVSISGIDLIQRELGGQIIAELDEG